MFKEMSLVCRALSDPTRLRIVKLLAVSELPVCELMLLLAAGQSRVSQNLATLKHADLVTDVRRERLVYYALNRARFERFMAELQGLIGNADLEDIPDMRDEAARWRTLHKNGRIALCSPAQAGLGTRSN